MVHNFPNLRLEAHVQHSVSFIQHKISAPSEVCLSCLKEVDEPSRSGDADLNTFNRTVIVRTKFWIGCDCWIFFLRKKSYCTPFQVTDLGSFGCSSIDTGGLEARSSAIFCSYLLYLLCQLTGRGEHQALSMKYTSHVLQVSQQASSHLVWSDEARNLNAQNLQKLQIIQLI